MLTAESPAASFNSSGCEIYYSDEEGEHIVLSSAAISRTLQVVGKSVANKMEWVSLCSVYVVSAFLSKVYQIFQFTMSWFVENDGKLVISLFPFFLSYGYQLNPILPHHSLIYCYTLIVPLLLLPPSLSSLFLHTYSYYPLPSFVLYLFPIPVIIFFPVS
jgi:hypothetical protein